MSLSGHHMSLQIACISLVHPSVQVLGKFAQQGYSCHGSTRLCCHVEHAMQVCVVSRGSKACLVSSRNGEVFSCNPPEVTVVDTVGAGDCFAAGFLHAYLWGSSLQVPRDLLP